MRNIKAAPKPAKKLDKKVSEDRGETIGLMEPMRVSETSPLRGELHELALELGIKSASFRAALPPDTVDSLSELVRSMNCYYSNLIEGHRTHPVDIERAMHDEYSDDPEVRDLQLEAKAHIKVQRWLDEGNLRDQLSEADALRTVHRMFCEELPESLLWVENPDTKERLKVTPGELRETDVMVGRHVAVSAGALPRFLIRFNQAYSGLGRNEKVIAAAGAHHRLLWIHPFLDGNGRVARLMSHATLAEALDTGGLWSVARGLARSVDRYKAHLASCDAPRHGNRDGRGTLSEAALANFSKFFLEICIDQVEFMQSLMQPDALRKHVLRWLRSEIEAGALPKKSIVIVEAIFYRGSLPRSELESLLGVAGRTARRTASALLERGVIKAENHKAHLKLAFPVSLATEWMPGLYPEH